MIEVVSAIAHGKSDRETSRLLGMGPNYVGQLLTHGKTAMKLPTFVKLLEKLGSDNVLYILFGTRPGGAGAAEVIDAVLAIEDPAVKAAALEHLRKMQSFSAHKELQHDDRDEPEKTRQERPV